MAVGRMIEKRDLRLRPLYQPALDRVVMTSGIGTVRLNGGPLVRPETLAMIERWQRDAGAYIPTGAIIDRLANFAHARGFNAAHLEANAP